MSEAPKMELRWLPPGDFEVVAVLAYGPFHVGRITREYTDGNCEGHLGSMTPQVSESLDVARERLWAAAEEMLARWTGDEPVQPFTIGQQRQIDRRTRQVVESFAARLINGLRSESGAEPHGLADVIERAWLAHKREVAAT